MTNSVYETSKRSKQLTAQHLRVHCNQINTRRFVNSVDMQIGAISKTLTLNTRPNPNQNLKPNPKT